MLVKLFCKKQTEDLKKELQETKELIDKLKEELLEKQKHINTTNAYWKKKMREVSSKKKKDL